MSSEKPKKWPDNKSQAAVAEPAGKSSIPDSIIIPSVFLILIGSVLINLTPIHGFGGSTGNPGYPALVQNSRFGTRGGSIVQKKWGLYLFIRKTYPGIKIMVPTGWDIDVAELYGLAHAKDVVFKDYNPRAISLAVEPQKILMIERPASESSGQRPTAIALGSVAPKEMILLLKEDNAYFADSSLLESSDD